MVVLFKGCYTALVTPMDGDMNLDYEALHNLIDFQVREGVSGIVVAGTTGESPTLTWEEHISIIESAWNLAGGRCHVIAGTGSNNTREALEATERSVEIGVKTVLLVDPYYNGPSSLEIRREYIEPIAGRFSETQVIPYIIPGRTGTQLQPQDLALLHDKFPNVNAVKEATGNLENARMIRRLCGEDFSILSGDDDKTFGLMEDPMVRASGVVSVTSNIAPRAVQSMVEAVMRGDYDKGREIAEKLKPLFEIVTVNTVEDTPYGAVSCKARNPLPYKTLMAVLGFPVGPCRPPLGKVTRKGFQIILEKARQVYEGNPEILGPIEGFLDVDLGERLYQEKYWRGLTYEGY
ncbi:MAG: 4-hydroxy-tetrahydrodipicolinate synthase [Candidatus Bathyarchaeia archaeon]